ncbi:hypothetical protein EV421DRAFT_1124020 [Armillaria borealis]|uniref:Secreted protein n=1 Tax=Armillaria borealis TaxID=47425 RepID=A0AA39J6S5_9AGAR|nr:hypothetical protein EV421DRAFT_1124020 [Armillaria borealis]
MQAFLFCLSCNTVIGLALCSNLRPSNRLRCLVYSPLLINITYAYTIKPSLVPFLPCLDLGVFESPSVLLYFIFRQGHVQIAVRKYICFVAADLTNEARRSPQLNTQKARRTP